MREILSSAWMGGGEGGGGRVARERRERMVRGVGGGEGNPTTQAESAVR